MATNLLCGQQGEENIHCLLWAHNWTSKWFAFQKTYSKACQTADLPYTLTELFAEPPHHKCEVPAETQTEAAMNTLPEKSEDKVQSEIPNVEVMAEEVTTVFHVKYDNSLLCYGNDKCNSVSQVCVQANPAVDLVCYEKNPDKREIEVTFGNAVMQVVFMKHYLQWHLPTLGGWWWDQEYPTSCACTWF